MAEKRDLDDVDLEILSLLSEDARRPFSEIAEHVDLSPPAVSDRVDRLREQGVIRRFTVDVDRSKVQPRTPVLVELDVAPAHVDDVYRAVAGLKGVEHAFVGVDGRMVVHASAPEDVRAWLRSGVDLENVTGLDVTLLDRFEWRVGIDDGEFALSCVVCGNSVGDGGVTVSFDGEPKAFCCPSCLAAYEERYERLSSDS